MSRLVLFGLLAGCTLAGCKNNPPSPKADDHKPVKPPVATPAEDQCTKAKQEGPIAWIADDYPAALACARQNKVPLVLDLWAPWCHTCLSMQTTVFMDPSFAADKNRFVFASLDTDRESNAPALTKLSISAWPTFYVIGNDETVLARFVGSASISQFQNFIESGALALTSSAAAADAHVLGAERALAVKDYATAETELVATLKAEPDAWLRRAEIIGSLILTKYKRNDFVGCLDVAEQYMPVMGNAAVASDFLATAMQCAEKRQKEDVARVKAVRETAVLRWKKLLADPDAQLSVDDRSDAMASLRETLELLGNKPEAKAIAEHQRTLLDQAAAKAPTPFAAMTYNFQRAEVYFYLGKGMELVPVLEKSAHDLPTEYDPRARLGALYLKMGKLAEATKWTDEALTLVYGPRKGRLLSQRAEIAAAANDKVAERSYRELAVKLFESLPQSQQSPDALAKAQKALLALDQPSGSGAGSGSGSGH